MLTSVRSADGAAHTLVVVAGGAADAPLVRESLAAVQEGYALFFVAAEAGEASSRTMAAWT